MIPPERLKQIQEESKEFSAYGHTDMLKELLQEIKALEKERDQLRENLTLSIECVTFLVDVYEDLRKKK